jgi:hypothetical protein
LRKIAVVVLALAGLAVGPASAWNIPSPILPPGAAAVQPVAATHGRVFLLRGLLNVFSLGMDTLGRKIKAKGMPAVVTNFTNWRKYATILVSQYRTDKSIAPVVIIGHSLGADSAIDMANYLGANGVPVSLVVAFDGVHDGHKVGRGIAEVVNYYKSDGVGKLIQAGPGFTGRLSNIDVADRKGIDHLNIEKSAALHAEVIARMTRIFAVPTN